MLQKHQSLSHEIKMCICLLGHITQVFSLVHVMKTLQLKTNYSSSVCLQKSSKSEVDGLFVAPSLSVISQYVWFIWIKLPVSKNMNTLIIRVSTTSKYFGKVKSRYLSIKWICPLKEMYEWVNYLKVLTLVLRTCYTN